METSITILTDVYHLFRAAKIIDEIGKLGKKVTKSDEKTDKIS